MTLNRELSTRSAVILFVVGFVVLLLLPIVVPAGIWRWAWQNAHLILLAVIAITNTLILVRLTKD